MASKKVKAAAAKKAAGKKRNYHTTGFIFWICLILIATPIAVLGWILLSSAMDTGKPVLGNRYEGDLDPAITSEQMTEVEQAVAGLEGIEDSSVRMVTATMRVYADVPDEWGIDDVKSKASEIYETVTGILDPAVYFTQADGRKMYDIEIHVYNLKENRDADEFVYVIRNKTSSMSEPISSVVSEPLDAELAQQLRDDVIAREEAEAAAKAEEEARQAEENGESSEGGEEASSEDSEG